MSIHRSHSWSVSVRIAQCANLPNFKPISLSRMKFSVIRLAFLVCTLDVTTSLAAAIPFDASSNTRNIGTRNLEVSNVHPRNIMAREPKPADLAAAAVGIERRNPIGAIVQVGKMIAEVIINIKKAFAADKEVRCHLSTVQPKVLFP